MTDPTPTRDEAVRKACHVLRQWAAFFNDDSARQSVKEIIDLLASDPAPASGGVDAVARRAKYLLNRLETDDGLGIGEIDTMLRMAASLSPAATPVSEAGGEAKGDIVERLQNDGSSWAQGLFNEAAAEIIKLRSALAKPVSSPAGGDVVREAKAALDLVRGIICEAALTGFNCHDGDWAERLYASQADTHAAVKSCDAALSQSTSAGRVGE